MSVVLGLATRAQMRLLWSYRGKVDWKTKLLKSLTMRLLSCLIMPEKTAQLLAGRSFQACFGIHTHVPFLLQQLLGMAMFPLCQAGHYGHISLGLIFSKNGQGLDFFQAEFESSNS